MDTADTLSGKLVVLFGGGFLGAHVAQELQERGTRLRVVSPNLGERNPIGPHKIP